MSRACVCVCADTTVGYTDRLHPGAGSPDVVLPPRRRLLLQRQGRPQVLLRQTLRQETRRQIRRRLRHGVSRRLASKLRIVCQ